MPPLCLTAVLFLVSCVSGGECGTGGSVYWGTTRYVSGSLEWDSGSWAGGEYITVKASYIPSGSVDTIFYYWSEVYSTSYGTPKMRFCFDTESPGAPTDGRLVLGYDSGMSNGRISTPTFLCVKDFRYSIFLDHDDWWRYLRGRIEINQGGSGFVTMTVDHGLQDCFRGGCRNTDLSRTSYACQMSPSRSKTPSPTASHTPTPTASRTISQTAPQTISSTPPPMISATDQFTADGRPFNRRRLVFFTSSLCVIALWSD
jgi:hypothetical protein